jgi:D-amino-acid dehydrogenase
MRAVAHYVDRVERWESEGHDTSFYRVAGELLVALDDSELDRLGAVHEQSRRAVEQFGGKGVGPPVILEAGELARRFALLGPARGAVLLPEVGQVDGRALKRHLLGTIADAGSVVTQGSARVVIEDDGKAAALVEDRHIVADEVIVAAGVWTPAVLNGLVGASIVSPQRGQLVHARLAGSSELPCVSGFRGHYALAFADDRIVVGATRESNSGFAVTATVAGIEQVLSQARELVPSIGQAELLEVRVGLRPASADGLPVVGRLPGFENLSVVTGFGPQGLTVGLYTGMQLAVELDGEASSIPASFRPARLTA